MMKSPFSHLLLVPLLLTGAPSVAPAAEAEARASEARTERALCHVCRVREGEDEPEAVVARSEHEGETYGFCSEGCKEAFDAWPEAYIPAALPRPAPEIPRETLNRGPLEPEALEGRVVLLDFWATWCLPCVEALPRLQEMAEAYGERGLTVVGVSIDEGRKAQRKVERLLRREDVTYPVVLDSPSDPSWVRWKVAAVPSAFLVDRQGRVVRQWSGRVSHEEVERAVREVLGTS